MIDEACMRRPSVLWSLLMVACLCVVGAHVGACDRNRAGDETERATQQPDALRVERLAGVWRVVETETDYTRDWGDPFSEGAGTKLIRIRTIEQVDGASVAGQMTRPDGDSMGEPAGERSGSVKTSEGALFAELYADDKCDDWHLPIRLKRDGDVWTTRYGLAEPIGQPAAANKCRMSVVRWSVKPAAGDAEAAPRGKVDALEFKGVERKGNLVLEGEARCRAEDAVEMVDRLDGDHHRRVWRLERVETASDAGVGLCDGG